MTEETIQAAGKHQAVEAKLWDNREKAPRELERQLVVFFFVDAAVFGGSGEKVTAAVLVETTQVKQKIQRGDHAAANLAHGA